MGTEISRVLHSGSAKSRTLSVNHLRADWLRQTFRALAPCKGTKDFQWVRTGAVTSLGQLFLVLGETFTAAEIYQFYRTLRIVAVKRRKQIRGHSPEKPIPTHKPKHAQNIIQILFDCVFGQAKNTLKCNPQHSQAQTAYNP